MSFAPTVHSADFRFHFVLWHPLKSLSDLIMCQDVFSIVSSVHQYLLCSSVAVTITSIQILMASALWATRKKSRSYVFTQKVRLGRGDWEWQKEKRYCNKHSQCGKYRNVSEILLNYLYCYTMTVILRLGLQFCACRLRLWSVFPPYEEAYELTVVAVRRWS